MDNNQKVKSRWTRSFFTALNRRNDDERYVCDICHKDLASPSSLTLHRNTHVIERRYKCEPCQVSFHSQGHLQKHMRSTAHETRVEMTQAFGIPTSDNPRPYGCHECDVAFRKHGHLAKHLRSKSHITKMEANGLVPVGTYAALDKCGAEVRDRLVTTNCEQSLQSLRSIAFSLFHPSSGSAAGACVSAPGAGGAKSAARPPAPLAPACPFTLEVAAVARGPAGEPGALAPPLLEPQPVPPQQVSGWTSNLQLDDRFGGGAMGAHQFASIPAPLAPQAQAHHRQYAHQLLQAPPPGPWAAGPPAAGGDAAGAADNGAVPGPVGLRAGTGALVREAQDEAGRHYVTSLSINLAGEQ